MSHLIHSELDRKEGSFMRILGLIERRGFHIDALELVDLGEDKRGLNVTVRIRDAARTIGHHGLQIDRLDGIKRLDRDPRGAAAPKKAKQEARA